MMTQGAITGISGPVIDVRFDGDLPAINQALTVELEGRTLTMEVEQHIGGNTVRCVLMDSGDGLCRGMKVAPTGHGIRVPVGSVTLGRMFSVLGQPIDGMGDVPVGSELWEIHRRPPKFSDQRPAAAADTQCAYTTPPTVIYNSCPIVYNVSVTNATRSHRRIYYVNYQTRPLPPLQGQRI